MGFGQADAAREIPRRRLDHDAATGGVARGYKTDPPPVLLDVRTLAEWNVSHLPRARRVDPKATAQEAAGGLPKDVWIVAYCSVGYRSGLLARRLRSAGFTHVQDLEGSIFQWANEGRPLVQDGHPARQVHPYSATLGKTAAPGSARAVASFSLGYLTADCSGAPSSRRLSDWLDRIAVAAESSAPMRQALCSTNRKSRSGPCHAFTTVGSSR